MPTVEIWKRDRSGNNDSKLGQGTGDKDGATVTLQAWGERAGVANGTKYNLKVDRTWYSGTAQVPPPPGAVAHFTGVE
jgi:hypothetical protein